MLSHVLLQTSPFAFQVKVTPKHNEEAKKLLTLMGIPYVNVCSMCWLTLYFQIVYVLHFPYFATTYLLLLGTL